MSERSLRWRERAPWVVAGAFTVSGVIHLARPQVFTGIVPGNLPGKTELVYASGVAELVCAAGLWPRKRWAGVAAAVLLLAVWPANLKMAIDLQGAPALLPKIIGWGRMPLQVPLIWAALQAGASSAGRQPLHRRRPAGVPTLES